MAERAISQQLDMDEDFLQFVIERLPEANVYASIAEETQVQVLDGNVNRVRRIHFRQEGSTIYSCIVKHVPAGGLLARYPSIVFPEDRLEHEASWYRFIEKTNADCKVTTSRTIRTPTVSLFDKESRTLITEDLGDRMLFSKFRDRASLKSILRDLGLYFGFVHSLPLLVRGDGNPSAERNREFVFRFHIDFPEEVQKFWKSQILSNGDSDSFKQATRDFELRIKEQENFLTLQGPGIGPLLQELLERFKQGTNCAYTHGDLHPGSMLVLATGTIGIIDSELSDYGNGSFDFGTLSAHLLTSLLLSGKSLQDAFAVLAHLLNPYIDTLSQGPEPRKNSDVALEIIMYAGAEMLRRLIGPAGFSATVGSEQMPFLLGIALDLLREPRRMVDVFANV